MLVNLMSDAFFSDRSRVCGFFSLVMINRCLPFQDHVDQFFRLVDACGHIGFIDRFPVKTYHLHVFVCSNNDTVRFLDFFRRQHVFRSAGAVGFCLQEDAHFLRFLFQGFCRHEGMCNSCRAGGNCQNTDSLLLLPGRILILLLHCGSRLCFLHIPLLLLFIDGLQEFLRCVCIHQLLAQIHIHQKDHQP